MDYKERILLAAHTLFLKYGFKTVTVDDICFELGISKKTLYEHFNNKNEIVQLMTQNYLQNSESDYEELVKQSQNAIEENFLVLRKVEEMFKQMNPRLVHEMQRYYPAAWEYFSDFKEKHFLKRIIANLNWGIKEGLYRDNLSIEVIARMRLEQGQMIFNSTVYDPSKYDLKQVNRTLLFHYLYGISTQTGNDLIKQYENENLDERR